ncbi:LemA family protein [Brevibacterium metallidurans]|uniref:LemA family protein n=1 Tax=Brevibacterium metallidurans TaxID=1482676 RepID=A0ABN0SLH6_9MICO
MIWTIIAAGAASVLIVAAVMLIILRFNQLSMARSLCDEAKRQLVVELRARHGLVPAFIGTIGQVTTRDLGSLELALASAERAPFGPRGAAAENALTAAIDDAALLPGRRGGGPGTAPADAASAAVATTSAQAGMRDELDMTVHLLHGQLTVLSERIVAVSRLYNANVDRYHRQRGRLLSRIFGGVFRPRDHFTEAPSDTVEPSPGPTVASTSSTAQPPAPAPSTPENRPDRTDRPDRSGRGVVEA